MKCQILFSGKNKKNIINLPSAENAKRVVKVKCRLCNCYIVIPAKYKYFRNRRRKPTYEGQSKSSDYKPCTSL